MWNVSNALLMSSATVIVHVSGLFWLFMLCSVIAP